MYYVQNCMTGAVWHTTWAEAKFYCSEVTIAFYNVYKVGGDMSLCCSGALA